MTLSYRTLLQIGLLLSLAACSSVSRRSTSPATPWWEEAPKPTALTPVAVDTTAAPSDAVLLADTRTGVGLDSVKLTSPSVRQMGDSLSLELSAEALAARRTAYAARTGAERDRVHQVNEYALWCLHREMWEEARVHLEQAVATDSLAASLHNNLGIVYERMGQREKASSRYRTAAQLNPGRPLYEANLKRLQDAAEARPQEAPSDSVAVDEILGSPSRPGRRPDLGAMPTLTEGEAHPERR